MSETALTAAEQLAAAWQRAMLTGDFEQAWCVSDRVRALGLPDPHRYWQGEDFTGKRVILRCLHGFGDSVQFLRYVPRLRARAASVCVEVAPRFTELAHSIEGVHEVITWGEEAPVTAPEWDVQIEVNELPYVFRTQLAELPMARHYLRPRAVPRPLAATLQVGLVWTAGEWNPTRAVAFALLEPLLAVRGCAFWNLTARTAPCGVGAELLEDARCRESLVGMAERVAGLDLVITTDTLAAHLAGAMGLPAWVMLRHEADWRWMEYREDSPWYPSLRLFRQVQDGDWPGVVARVTEALRDLVQDPLLDPVRGSSSGIQGLER